MFDGARRRNPTKLHLALSWGVYFALVFIISNLLNIFHIINFNYLCFFQAFELI